MKLMQKLKQHFCRHTHAGVTHYTTPFLGWTCQCPKCNGYIAYFKEWDHFTNISEKQYNIFKEAGKKLLGFESYEELHNNNDN